MCFQKSADTQLQLFNRPAKTEAPPPPPNQASHGGTWTNININFSWTFSKKPLPVENINKQTETANDDSARICSNPK